MKEHKGENYPVQFLKFLISDDSRFRKAVFYSPLVTSIGSYILNWLILGKSFSESLYASAFIFLLICFIGLVYEAFKRRNFH